MAHETKDGDIVIFKNDKRTSDNQPEYTEKLHLNGTDYRVALWVKQGEKGKFFAGNVGEF